MPGAEAKLVGVLAPGIGLTGLGDDSAEVGVGQHVHPGCRGLLPGVGGDDVLATIRGETAHPVAQDQVTRRQLAGALGRALSCGKQAGSQGRGQGGNQARDVRRGCDQTIELFRQGPGAVAHHRPGHGQEQGTILLGDLLCRAHEDPPRALHGLGFLAHRDQAQDALLQFLPVTGAVLVPDHQVHGQSLEAPIGMGLDELADQFDVGQVADAQQDDGQVTGDGIGPESGLSAPVAHEHAGLGPQPGMGVEDRGGQTGVELGIGRAGIDLAQHHLGVGPGQVEDAVGQAPILVLFDQVQARVAVLADPVDQVHGGRLFRSQGDPTADGDHRVQHRALGAGQGGGAVHRQGRARGTTAADEAGAVGLEGRPMRGRAGLHVVHGHQVEEAGWVLVVGAGAAGAEDGPVGGQDLRLDEQVAEGRVQGVGGGRGQYHLGVAGDLDGAASLGAVGEAHPAQLDVVLR